MTGLDPRAMRRVNAESVLRALYRERSLPLATLSQAIGVSRRTVELILTDLEKDGWIRTRPPQLHENGRGRPRRHFEFRDGAGAVLGVEIAHDRSTAVVADLRGRPLASIERAAVGEPDRAGRLALTRDTITAALTAAGLTPEQIGAVAIATPGNVDDNGVVSLELSMRGWTGVSLAAEFAADFDCPLHVENNAKLAVLAELWEGATPGADHVLWLMLEGQYNGMSIVVDGVPYRGVDGAAGEIFWAKVLGLDELASSSLIGLGRLQPAARRAEGMQLVRRARAGDPESLAEVQRFAAILARGLSTLGWILAPRFIVLGGSLSAELGSLLADRVNALVRRDGPPFVEVRLSELDNAAVTRGAIRAALDRFPWTAIRPIPHPASTEPALSARDRTPLGGA
ncbi:ROK family transcriptional regulator [Micromonospora zingiberis]|nr:ROK family transcriptional regulator [Micromonospora zingiberis]